LVKKVLVHDRRTLEVWYALPNRRGFADCNKWLPEWDTDGIRPVAIIDTFKIKVIRLLRGKKMLAFA